MLSRRHSPVAEQAGAGRLCRRGARLPAGRGIVLLCGSGDRVALLSETHNPVPATRLGPYRHTCPAARRLAGEGSFQRRKLGMENEFWSTWICTGFCAVYV